VSASGATAEVQVEAVTAAFDPSQMRWRD